MDDPGFFEALARTPLLQQALAAGALAGACCAALSPLVVLRRMAFVGDGLAHAAFGGMGLALFMLTSAPYDDVRVRLLTIAFCVAVGLAVGYVSRRGRADAIGEDSAIGIAFSVSMALGALLIALRQRMSPQYVPTMDSYLFGSLLSISTSDVYALAALAAALLLFMLLFFKEIQFYAFDTQLAEVCGVRVSLVHYAFMVLLSLAVVVSSRVVGIVLVAASLVLPGVTALKFCNRLAPAMLLAAVLGTGAFVSGIALSYLWNVPPGSAIVLIQFVLLLFAFAFRRFAVKR